MTVTIGTQARDSAAPKDDDRRRRLLDRSRLSFGPEGGLILVIVVLAVATEIRTPVMLEPANVIEILRSTVVYFVAACAATIVITSGGLDLAIGATTAAGGIAAGAAMNAGVPWAGAILVGILAGAAVGALSAVLIIRVRVPAFVATLGMFFLVEGIISASTGGTPLFGFPAGFNRFGQGDLFGLPYLIWYGTAIGIVFHVVFRYTRFGYNVRSVGGNATAALQNGVRVNRVTAAAYVIGGGCAALAGVLLAAQQGGADPGSGGAVFTFEVFAAVIVGGTSLFGGIGSIWGSALGSLLFSVLDNSMALFDVNPLWLQVVTGVVLILAVAFDQARRRRQFRSRLT